MVNLKSLKAVDNTSDCLGLTLEVNHLLTYLPLSSR